MSVEESDSAKLARLRERLLNMSRLMRDAVMQNPGTIVLYEPLMIADVIEALANDTTTTATDMDNIDRANRISDTVSTGTFRMQLPTMRVQASDVKP